MSINLTLEERETVIIYNETTEPAEIFTYNRALINKLDSLIRTKPGDITLKMKTAEGGKKYTIPKSWVKISPPKAVSEKQKEKARETMKRLKAEGRL